MDYPQERLSIAVLGCGFMGTAIIKGLLTSIRPGHANSDDFRMEIYACVRFQESFDRVQKALGDEAYRVQSATHLHAWSQAVDRADVVMLGIPPAELKAISENVPLCKSLRGKLVVSLLAGTSCEQVTEAFVLNDKMNRAGQFHVIRVIPSIGAQNLDSVSMIADTPHAGDEQKAMCDWIFRQIGSVHYLPEGLMNEATATHATCNALAMVAIDAITDAAVAEGMSRSQAMALAAQSLKSAAGLLESGMTPESLKESMSVPKGITINALLDLERGQVRSATSDATRNAIKYTRNMTNQTSIS
ncbi:pyrroline-5-carboxylate reductase [Aureobasidium sp. EXF-10728]|nr:pyrroline-5-carboxylate reductase [Aureobasidium sp. EXF-10728]